MRRILISIVLFSGVAMAPALAQGDAVNLRVEKLEKEMKAVQRKVFPNGQPIQPEMGGVGDTAGTSGSGTAVADLASRLEALENQLKRVTGDVELYGNRLAKLENVNKALETRLKALETPAPAEEQTASAEPPKLPAAIKPEPKPLIATPKPTPKPAPKIAMAAQEIPAASAEAPKADPKLKARIDSVAIPRTGDAAEDNYTYGFRLWQAKLFPEAQKQLQNFLKKYPKHKKSSFAGNLLGRAFFDEGKYALAAVAFYDNFKRDAKGERAQESLYNLGQSLTKLKKLPDACKAYAEFGDVYGTAAAPDLRAKVAKGKVDAKCAA